MHIGLARTMYIRFFGREFTKFTVIYGILQPICTAYTALIGPSETCLHISMALLIEITSLHSAVRVSGVARVGKHTHVRTHTKAHTHTHT
jgi:hypothetical protein